MFLYIFFHFDSVVFKAQWEMDPIWEIRILFTVHWSDLYKLNNKSSLKMNLTFLLSNVYILKKRLAKIVLTYELFILNCIFYTED